MKLPNGESPTAGMLVIPLNFQGATVLEQTGPIVAALMQTVPTVLLLHLCAQLLILSANPELQQTDEAGLDHLTNRMVPLTNRLQQMMVDYQTEQQQAAGVSEGPIEAGPIYAALGFFINTMLQMQVAAAEAEQATLNRAIPGWRPEMMGPGMQA